MDNRFRGIIAITAIIISIFFGGCEYKQPAPADEVTAIINAKIFDGENVIDDTTVVIKDGIIQSVGGNIPEGAAIIDAAGKTLMPGLIDSHTHTDVDGLKDALKFGVTTELAMNGRTTKSERKQVAEQNDIADMRSPEMAVTAPGGHPTQYQNSILIKALRWLTSYPPKETKEAETKFVNKQIAAGADYIKIIIEEGAFVGYPGLPVLNDEGLIAAVEATHAHGKLAIAHITTAENAQRAAAAGADGLAHMFFDNPQTREVIDDIASSGMFVIPTLTAANSIFGNSGAVIASDERVSSKLSEEWLASLSDSMNIYPEGDLGVVFANVKALHDVGVDILAGTDVSEAGEGYGGLAHGASMHHELQLLAAAGLTPIEALRAATSVPARRFGLNDRGRIAAGLRADLLLLDGDPLVNLSDTLNISAVWRGGVQLMTKK
ncbi:imidazolonepropionase [Spirochaetia bacterium]|nr:imidazolonepropionase [Spirochaetia bacterium]